MFFVQDPKEILVWFQLNFHFGKSEIYEFSNNNDSFESQFFEINQKLKCKQIKSTTNKISIQNKQKKQIPMEEIHLEHQDF